MLRHDKVLEASPEVFFVRLWECESLAGKVAQGQGPDEEQWQECNESAETGRPNLACSETLQPGPFVDVGCGLVVCSQPFSVTRSLSILRFPFVTLLYFPNTDHDPPTKCVVFDPELGLQTPLCIFSGQRTTLGFRRIHGDQRIPFHSAL